MKNYGLKKLEETSSRTVYKKVPFKSYKVIFNNVTKRVQLGTMLLDMKLLKAINEKVKELGWEE